MGKGMRGAKWEEGMEVEGVTKLKTNVISDAVDKKQKKRCLWLSEACLAACSRGWVQHY